jgi:uncharacterized protein (TIGR03083 family)
VRSPRDDRAEPWCPAGGAARIGTVDLFEEIADERRALADQLAPLTPAQQSSPSLCGSWTVHQVTAHLVMPMEVGLPRMLLAVLASGGRFDRANDRVARRLARRPFVELVTVLRERAGHRFTPPGAGPEAPLLDVLVHGLDVRRPLGLTHEVPAPRLRVALDHAVTAGLGPKGALTGLRLEATDLDWSHGDGPLVRGGAEALLLATTGRAAGLGALEGDGVPVLRGRLVA